MALAERVPFRGRLTGVMAEYFATTADVFRLLGQLEEEFDRHPAADGGPKTLEGSARRLLRMVGIDLGAAALAEARALAALFAEAQLRRIADALALVLSRFALPADAPSSPPAAERSWYPSSPAAADGQASISPRFSVSRGRRPAGRGSVPLPSP